MKNMVEAVGNGQPEPKDLEQPQKGTSLLAQYSTAGILLAVICFVLITAPINVASTDSADVAWSFLLLWLTGGCITLVILTRAAKKPG